jgi:hypothetical protein
MCSICNCELPRHRDGHVTKATIKAHNQGRRHTDNVFRQEYLDWCPPKRSLRRAKWVDAQNPDDARQALLLGVVVTRLRAAHGSMDAARTAWAVESDAALNRLESPALKTALWRPAAAHVAQQHVSSAASDAWPVVNLVIAWAHA